MLQLKGRGFVSHPLNFRDHQFGIFGLLIVVKPRYRLSMSTGNRMTVVRRKQCHYLSLQHRFGIVWPKLDNQVNESG
ncbi:hypothetical protein HanRHA438_Chr04g0150991 [Helianthus annuus]|uniref:Uncharacterized protein n=1 Tax=Helianthus annuus TaxID=4232 RepID=A0A251UV29_HELAN|nr:hypothetical protein HanXRQr2_Chr04g0139511 [Helianthus annuus]KAJ0579225.1 hypothetical protein HanHA300_Chr04g0115651 [Helianthus annuus]KAJ0595120.1 hypothetical protein HanHA89_Chr04g0127831 [Helianthus annuus]KAJ0924661.1 hypothetical protein HanRHA438_Chr04g0150991 [Helianthus annuus]KAJ0929284.1 hypothetical protein HanPSC8_Chr04g0135931 [Helianthus annuus]